jgi:acid phosphatase type 7
MPRPGAPGPCLTALIALLGVLACGQSSPSPPVADAARPVAAGLVRRSAARDQDVVITRGPYLQMGGPSRATVRWRTDRPVRGQLVARVAAEPSTAPLLATEGEAVNDHAIDVDGLRPDTRYEYTVGTAEQTLAGDDGEHFFVTAPPTGTVRPTRLWVIGDSGTADVNAIAVYDAYLRFAGDRHTDLWLMLGDNAYPSGTDEQYQGAVFDLYTALLPNVFLWPAIGNHETYFHPDGAAYLDIFSLPTRGEIGGIASGSELYYSFDHGNIHFVVLDSMISSRAAGAPMLAWLRADLEATDQTWVIAFWHHPPYTKSNHDSDNAAGVDPELPQMRANALPILEAHGVDLVLSGHSHSYERSYLLEGHHGPSDSFDDEMKRDQSSGDPRDTGAYAKITAGRGAGEGAVYVVAGSSGQVAPSLGRHPAMYLSLLQLGSLVIDVEDRQLSATFLDSHGSIRDQFAIEKGVAAATVVPGRPRALTATPGEGQTVTLAWSYPARDETGFLIERALEGEGFLPWKRLGANASAWVDPRVPYDTRVWYRVRATNSAGESPASNQAGVQLLDPASVDPGEPSVDAALPGPGRPSAGARATGGGGCVVGGQAHPGCATLALAGVLLGLGLRGKRRRGGAGIGAALALAGVITAAGQSWAHGSLSEQLARLDAQIARAPQMPAAYLQRAEIHRRQGQLDAALADWQRAMELDPRLPGLHLQVASTLLTAGRSAEAGPHLDRAVASPASEAAALLLRGQWHLARGHSRPAADDLTRAVARLGPAATADDHLQLVGALRAAGQPRRAGRALAAARRQLGPLVSLDLAAIDLALEQQQHDRALALIDEQIRATPRPASWLLRRGDVLAAAGRPTQARRAYQAALQSLTTAAPDRRNTPAMRALAAQAKERLSDRGPGSGE